MPQVLSKDGTSIAYDKAGNGPAVLLVDGAMGYRGQWGSGQLATELAEEFAVYTYDRRGRGESTDTEPYSVEREIEDIDALIDEAGGSVYLYGLSSGAALALKAAGKLGASKVQKLALYEPPFTSEDLAEQDFSQYTRKMAALLQADRRGDAVAFFLADMLPAEMIEDMRQSPEWPIMEAVAPTIAYDNAVMGDGSLPVEDAKAATMPALVLAGGASLDFMNEVTEPLAKAMPQARHQALECQSHIPKREALAAALAAFFKA